MVCSGDFSGSGVFRRVLFMMCLCGELCQFWLYVSSDVSWLGVGIWLCFMFKGWYGELLNLLWMGAAVIVAVALLCFMLRWCFSVFWNGLGMLWRLLDVRGEPPPILASLSSIV